MTDYWKHIQITIDEWENAIQRPLTWDLGSQTIFKKNQENFGKWTLINSDLDWLMIKIYICLTNYGTIFRVRQNVTSILLIIHFTSELFNPIVVHLPTPLCLSNYWGLETSSLLSQINLNIFLTCLTKLCLNVCGLLQFCLTIPGLSDILDICE